MNQVVAERALEFYGEDGVGGGVVRAYAPYCDLRLEKPWICKFEVSWPGYEERRSVFCADSWAALFAASTVVPRLLAAAPDFSAGRIGIGGQRLSTVEQTEMLLGFREAIQ